MAQPEPGMITVTAQSGWRLLLSRFWWRLQIDAWMGRGRGLNIIEVVTIDIPPDHPDYELFRACSPDERDETPCKS